MFTDGGRRRTDQNTSGIGYIVIGYIAGKAIRLVEGGGWWTEGVRGADSLETEIVAIDAVTKIVDQEMSRELRGVETEIKGDHQDM